MQGLADGYFIIPYTIGGYLAGSSLPEIEASHPAFKESAMKADEQIHRLLAISGKRTVDEFHRELGLIMWDHCGMTRNKEGLEKAMGMIQSLRGAFWENVKVPGEKETLNQSLERAGRAADYLEFAELMVLDALERKESCGAHFNEAYQTPENEALRDDENFSHVAGWEYAGEKKAPVFHKEALHFERVKLAQRSYK
jgi:succinate dehydrogenase / fumarate reductase flavoprotein subunit